MIAGIVNEDFEPIIPRSVYGSDGKVYIFGLIAAVGYFVLDKTMGESF